MWLSHFDWTDDDGDEGEGADDNFFANTRLRPLPALE